MAVIVAIDSSLLANDSPLPTWLIFLIAAAFYLIMAVIIGVIGSRKKNSGGKI